MVGKKSVVLGPRRDVRVCDYCYGKGYIRKNTTKQESEDVYSCVVVEHHRCNRCNRCKGTKFYGFFGNRHYILDLPTTNIPEDYSFTLREN